MRQHWNERAVVCGLQAGDREAWALLFDHHSERVWRYVARLVGNDRSGIADVVQDTFLAAAQSARSYDPTRGPLATWLLGIAHRQAAQYRRRAGRLPPSSEVVGDLAARNGDPVALLDQQETNDVVRQTLAELPADYAVLLIGKYADDRSIDDLVTEYGGTTESVRSRLARARRAFTEHYERLAATAATPRSLT